TNAMAKKEFTQALTGAVLISFGRLAGPHQVAQGLMRSVGYPHRGKVPRAQTTRQLFRVPAIGLDSISGLHRNQGRSYDVAAYAKGSQLPIEHVSGGAGLVAGVQLLHRTELAHQSSNRLFAVGNRTQGADFSVRFGDCNSNGFGMDI